MDFYEYFTLEYEKGFLHVPKVLIVGDFNSNILSPKLPEWKLLDILINVLDLHEVFHGPTRITESASTHLDVFLTNCLFAFADVLAKAVWFSDHHIIMGTYLAGRTHLPCAHKVVYARNYRKIDSGFLCDLFTDETWDAVFKPGPRLVS